MYKVVSFQLVQRRRNPRAREGAFMESCSHTFFDPKSTTRSSANTSSFNVGKRRWLVLDEVDRLMVLGFEDTDTRPDRMHLEGNNGMLLGELWQGSELLSAGCS